MFNQKMLFSSFLACLAIGVVTALAQQQNSGDPPAPAWTAIDEAINQGLPKTAIERLTPLIESALADKDYDEATKAIALRIMLEANIQGNQPEEKITRMKAEIAKAPELMKPIMEAILANWYWHYFQQNRWQFSNRTQVDETTSEDFTTWDLKRILSEIDSQFDKAFTGSETLKTSLIAEYSQILDPGTAPASYRPTMFDVLAHNALEFYSAAEQAGAKVQDAFELRVDSPIFAAREDFLAWKPTTTDESSAILRALQLYQELLDFHANDDDRSALLDADLLRLEFANALAVGEGKRERFQASLKRFEQANIQHEVSTRALHLLAEEIHSDGDFVQAHEVCEQAIARFTSSIGANACRNLIQRIESESAEATTERVWNSPWPTIDVRYRNLDKIYFRLVKFDFDEFIKSERWSPDYLEDSLSDRLLREQPVKAWSVDLPKTPDYKVRTEKTTLPDGLKPGSYYLISSIDENFSRREMYRQMTEVWVSDLAIVMRTDSSSGVVEGMVVNASSGEPIDGAKVRGFRYVQGRGNQRQEIPATTTNALGIFQFSGEANRAVLVLASHNGHSLSLTEAVSTYVSQGVAEANTQTRFFTDRAIYRPGQTIHYKGICVSSNGAMNSYQTLDRQKVSVVFSDPNGKEIERVEHVTNKFGSFNGSVTAPRDRVTGEMSIHVDSGPNGRTSIRVEEYKRPKFRVTLESPKEAAKLGTEVTVSGTATAYTGVAISDASVQWRVVREVQYPVWWYWSRWSMPGHASGSSQEIANGISTTSSNGTFDVAFVAKPDESVDPDSEPTFRYTVYADVTDTTGETRSDERSIQLGFTALQATMSAERWLTTDTESSISIRTTSIDGANQAAKGIVKIYALKQPDTVVRDELAGRQGRFNEIDGGGDEDEVTSSDPNDWPLGELAYETEFESDGAGNASVQRKLTAGVYRAVLESRDAFGKKVQAILPLHVLDPNASTLDVRVPNLIAIKNASVEPGDTFEMVWGTGYESATAYVEVEQDGKLLQSFWTAENQTQIRIRQEVTESMRGGFNVRVTMVRENRAYLTTQFIDVPWSNKELTIKWERFTSKLVPGQKETWTAVITGDDAKRAAAEMVATLYDASLDAFAEHYWMSGFGVFRQNYSSVQLRFQNQLKGVLVPISQNFEYLTGSYAYPRFSSQIVTNLWGYGFFEQRMLMKGGRAMPAPMAAMAMSDAFGMGGAMGGAELMADAAPGGAQVDLSISEKASDKSPAALKPDLSKITARTNLNETAFFFPSLVAGDDGTVRLEFTMPEALTEWKFFGFAHDSELRAGLLSDTIVTSKDLMVQPNPPRFLREGDVIEFTTKVSNRSATNQTGTVRLTLADANSTESVDAQLGNTQTDQDFSLSAGESKSFSWRLSVPEGIGFLTYKAIASSGRLSDGEEGYLPVLSKRILVTESQPLPIRGKQTKQFDFAKLLNSADSKTLKHESLTVQMVSNPSWYAVLALPYLMEYPYECNEQTFNRLYANALARHIVTSDPKIERVFAQWRGTPALDSPLSKNQDLKSVMLEETPWYAEAQNESQARRNVGVLFDQNRLESEIALAMEKLAESQRDDGAWSWFPGGPKNDYMTLYIATGFGRLRHLGVNIDAQPAIHALTSLDAWVSAMHKELKDHDPELNHLSSTIALYLYGRSFFLADQPIADEHREAVNYWLDQAKRHWLKLAVRQSQAHLAIAQKRFGDEASAKAIVDSIRERSVSDDELGMFWRENELAWFWYHAPIETQAMMIEMFDEVAGDAEAVEACKVWLLKQKQTQDWKTTKATGDAVYSLLLRGSNLLASNELVKVSLGGEVIEPTNVEAGTGFYQEKFTRSEVKPSMGTVVVTKVDEGVAWGSVHWQYLEDISAVTAHEGTPLTLSKQLFTKKNTPQGPTLSRVDGPVAVGDELVVRVVLRTDRDMEYLHMKDHRGSGTEPVSVLSQYKYQDGLAYYEATRDTASHFFIDYLPKGTFVFEYSTRVQLKGEYQTGVASIECMYAPEFNSHSESLPLSVQ